MAADFSLERHYTVAELAGLWHVDGRTVRRWIEGREDILKWGNEHPSGKHRYINIRVPETVARRVYQERVAA